LLCIGALINIVIVFLKLLKQQQKTSLNRGDRTEQGDDKDHVRDRWGEWLFISLFLVYVMHTLIHGVHYTDNIIRPVEYFEPKILYQRYIISTMELTFYFNWPLTFLGAWSVSGLLFFLRDREKLDAEKYCIGLFIYIIGAFLTVMHYSVAPPRSYTGVVNFTIAGEGIVALIFSGLAGLILCILFGRKQEANATELIVFKEQKDEEEEEDKMERENEIATSLQDRPLRRRSHDLDQVDSMNDK